VQAAAARWVGSDEAEVHSHYHGDQEKIARNRRLVDELKRLYGASQVEGDNLPAWLPEEKVIDLLEVHHIIPLGEHGPDERSNMIVLTPTLHALIHWDSGASIDLEQGEIHLPRLGKRLKIRVVPEHNG